jgi:hypothetical protein
MNQLFSIIMFACFAGLVMAPTTYASGAQGTEYQGPISGDYIAKIVDAAEGADEAVAKHTVTLCPAQEPGCLLGQATPGRIVGWQHGNSSSWKTYPPQYANDKRTRARLQEALHEVRGEQYRISPK